MKLIKSNPAKGREVYELDDCFRKIWSYKNIQLLEKHVNIMKDVWPGYILRYGWTDDTMWVDIVKVTGTPASEFPHTKEFIEKIYTFCLENIKTTAPYAHYDWVLSNILIDGEDIRLIDWDNIDIYDSNSVNEKLILDLKSAFGDKFDPTSI